MSLTLELSEPVLRLLREEAKREARTPEALASRLLTESLTYAQEMHRAIEEGSSEEDEAIRAGLADVAAGRVRPMDEVHAELRARFGLPTQVRVSA